MFIQKAALLLHWNMEKDDWPAKRHSLELLFENLSRPTRKSPLTALDGRKGRIPVADIVNAQSTVLGLLERIESDPGWGTLPSEPKMLEEAREADTKKRKQITQDTNEALRGLGIPLLPVDPLPSLNDLKHRLQTYLDVLRKPIT